MVLCALVKQPSSSRIAFGPQQYSCPPVTYSMNFFQTLGRCSATSLENSSSATGSLAFAVFKYCKSASNTVLPEIVLSISIFVNVSLSIEIPPYPFWIKNSTISLFLSRAPVFRRGGGCQNWKNPPPLPPSLGGGGGGGGGFPSAQFVFFFLLSFFLPLAKLRGFF